MAFEVKIETDNEAFAEWENFNQEVSRLLRYVAAQIAQGYRAGPLLDANGNTVGSYSEDTA